MDGVLLVCVDENELLARVGDVWAGSKEGWLERT